MSRCAPWLVLLVLAFGVVPSVIAAGRQQQAGAVNARPGPELFKTYCASCHGNEGTGNGPLARALRHAPSDLTQLSKRNGGMFPGARVRRIIDGRDVESHGDREMPVWGDAFKSTRDGSPLETADARIATLVSYLESIQQRDAQ
ncbi:MAG: c-type cytochrome [Luteitalea sp.]|nr:c-type cytochrome [Luteitalea sp.]